MTDELRPAFCTYAEVDPLHRNRRGIDPEAAEDHALNLAWTRDEREHLDVDLNAILADELRAEGEHRTYLDRYLVRDPYGEQTLGPAIAGAFGVPDRPNQITCGAGVVSLLHGLARLAPRDSIRILGDVYPDFPYWVAQHAAPSRGAPLWFLERPSLLANSHDTLDDVIALSEDAARCGAIVIIDESNANYYPLTWSAIRVAASRNNLVIIRGFSKAYGLGSLRLGFCFAAPALAQRIRSSIAPLLASSLSLRLGARVLSLGDVAAPLRGRIAANKRAALDIVAGIGVEALIPAAEHLPYVLSRASRDHLANKLESRGVFGKHHPQWSQASGTTSIYRLSVPLRESRASRFRQLLGQ